MLSPVRARKSDNLRKSNKVKKQITVPKYKAKKIKSNNFTGSIKKRSTLQSEYWKKILISP